MGLARLAGRVRGPAKTGLPALYVLTDPQRLPDPTGLAHRLPAGSALIYRHFGAPDRVRIARQLASIARQRGLVFLIGADADLADRVDADGVHWPERLLGECARQRARGDHRFFTAAAHSPSALRRAERCGADAMLFSAVFPSDSPSAGPAKGLQASAAATRHTKKPVIALGGVRSSTGKRLTGLGFSGIACVGAAADD